MSFLAGCNLGDGLFLIQSHGELAVPYCWALVLIAARGSAAPSVAAARRTS